MALFMSPSKKEPLIERHTRDAIARRSAEIIGAVLMLFAGVTAAMLASYSPDDPGLFHATSQPPQNLLGHPGALISDLIHRAIGWAGWAIPVCAAVWGLRFLLHRGEERILTRMIIAPFAMATLSVFIAAHVPPAIWAHDYGLGGLFGDAVLGGLLSILPVAPAAALKFVTLILAACAGYVGLAALGATMGEVTRFALWSGRSFMRAARALGRNLRRNIRRGLGLAGRHMAGAASQARDARRTRAATPPEAVDAAPPAKRRFGGFSRREPEIAPPSAPPPAGDDAIMARITAAVAARELTATPEEVTASLAPALGGVTPDDPDPEIELPLPDVTAPVADKPVAAPSFTTVVQNDGPKKMRKSARARAEEQPKLSLVAGETGAYETPPLALLADATGVVRHVLSNDALEENARMLENVLDDYGVKGEIVSVRPGPVVTMYELEPAAGLKASRVIGLADDIARSMSALAARVSTIPGRSVIGIELPNEKREMVLLREILSASAYGDGGQKLPLALGKDIAGDPIVANLAKMPHLLIAGTTGSGKSVAINTMILSLLYQLSPDECRLIMIDPKMLELSVYDGIPHLLSPVVTDPKKAVVALKWVVAEMEERYRKMSKVGVRNIDGYNARVRDALKKGEGFSRTVQTGFDDDTGEPVFETEEFTPETMPFIVVIVDEMADLMMVAGKEIEACIQRLAQMARASGIHLIMATQRPSVDVITGTIKANFPTRISFQVTSKVDSRTILGEMGAEQLLGMGDMLYMAGGGKVTRVHGPFVSDEEVEEVVQHLKSFGAPEYVSGVLDGPDDEKSSEIDLVLGLGGNTTGEDALYDQAVAIVARDRKCSTSYIQRKLAIGYNKAARLVEQMEDEGVVSGANHVGKREVLVPER